MTSTKSKDWKKEFGLDRQKPPHFFTSVDQIDKSTVNAPQAHALRRAFDLLKIEGVFCIERSPVIYFRQVESIDTNEIINLHRSFWNQGIAPILVIIDPVQVHIYSGLLPPKSKHVADRQEPGLVETLERVGDRLKSFLLSVESGEYFHIKRKYFDPNTRVDRDLLRSLQATRQELGEIKTARIEPQVLDILLCRLIFTCYLFDRGIIDRAYLKEIKITDVEHLRDILSHRPGNIAKSELYTLFGQLGSDFNGDLFTTDLKAECLQVSDKHIEVLDSFFHGTDIQTGQRSLWPYDFSFIPIETISAIYENFLKAAGEEHKKEAGAFYTPRFLAEFVIDTALENETTLLDKRFLDPACGSGIFLVGLFNRLAWEWKCKNPDANYGRRAKELMKILRTNIYGVDSNRSACKITAFSLYLAFLDQLSPPDIRKLLGKWERLPNLVSIPGETDDKGSLRTIICADFFTEAVDTIPKAHVIVGNPPWGPVKSATTTESENWCSQHKLEHPNREKSVPFIWKAAIHLENGGRICFLLPHGILFNHSNTAVNFQQSFFRTHSVDRVVNLTDYRFFLFEESLAPALVIKYRKEKPKDSTESIEYWAPKTDWAITQAEIVNILPQDRTRITVREVLSDLQEEDAPQIWKNKFWATPRDWQLIERLSIMERLRDIVSQPGKGAAKRWTIAEGFQPFGKNDPLSSKKILKLPTSNFIQASNQRIDLFILPSDCETLPDKNIETRRLIRNTSIFKAPHVLVTKGFKHSAFADFDVSFRHALRGIHGPESDRNLLIFLAAYLRSDIAGYFLFHTSSNWGVYRPEVQVEELLRLPFPLPEDTPDPKRCKAIIQEIVAIVTEATNEAANIFANRDEIVSRTQETVNKLIEEYFDIDEFERMLITDTVKITIPSIQPTHGKTDVPTIKQSNDKLRISYGKMLCERLNSWASREYMVHCKVTADPSIGVGIVVLEKTRRNEKPSPSSDSDGKLLRTLDNLQRVISKGQGTYELVRGLKIFDKNMLYITKPLGQRFWSDTAALNDADEIAATILLRKEPD